MIALLAITTMSVKAQESSDNKSLKQTLNEKKQSFNQKADERKKKVYADGLKAIEKSDILKKALNIGDKAIDFELTNATGKTVSLNNLLEEGPVVLTWYRGGWCPYCNITLHYLQENLHTVEAEGAQLVALSPEIPDKSLSTAEKHNLEFEVLSDLNNEVARKYGIVFKLTDAVEEYYKKSFSFSEYYGNDSGELPLAATYVISSEGIITYAFLDVDYRNRAEPEDIITALKKLK